MSQVLTRNIHLWVTCCRSQLSPGLSFHLRLGGEDLPPNSSSCWQNSPSCCVPARATWGSMNKKTQWDITTLTRTHKLKSLKIHSCKDVQRRDLKDAAGGSADLWAVSHTVKSQPSHDPPPRRQLLTRENENTLALWLHMHPDWESNLKPRYVPWAESDPTTTFSCTGWHSNQLSNPATGRFIYSSPNLVPNLNVQQQRNG